MELPLHPEFTTYSKRRHYLIGVSGGRDSIALLHALMHRGINHLIVCHLNHRLRGTESGQDATFVRRVAKKYNLPCEIEKTDVGYLAKTRGESIELAARNARLDFLVTCSKKHRCSRVLLAHHADDQAETILFNLLRGSGGLRGMHFHTTRHHANHKLEIFRPLLETPRAQIDHYIKEHNIPFREDTSNAEAFATRNRLRHEVIPLLNDVMNRKVSSALLRAADISQANTSAIAELLSTLELEDPQGRLFIPKLQQLSPAIQTHVFKTYLAQHNITEISHQLIDRCVTLLKETKTAKINLPGGKHLRRKEKRIFIQ